MSFDSPSFVTQIDHPVGHSNEWHVPIKLRTGPPETLSRGVTAATPRTGYGMRPGPHSMRGIILGLCRFGENEELKEFPLAAGKMADAVSPAAIC